MTAVGEHLEHVLCKVTFEREDADELLLDLAMAVEEWVMLSAFGSRQLRESDGVRVEPAARGQGPCRVLEVYPKR